MKKKYLLYAIPLVLLCSIWVYFQFNQSKVLSGFKLIPDNALYVLETKDPISNWTAFSQTEIWQILKYHPVMADLTDDADYLDTLISDNRKIFEWFDNTSLLISAHNTSAKDYDFLFVVGVSPKAKKSLLLPGLKQVLKSSGFTTSELAIETETVLKAADNSGESIFFAHVDNQLLCSYSKSILSQSLHTRVSNQSVEATIQFESTFQSVSKNGLCRFYLPFNQIQNLLNCYFEDDLSGLTTITKQLQSSSFDFTVDSDYWQVQGYTAIDSAQSSYVKAFTQSGESINEVGTVLSNRTAWSMSLNFESFVSLKSNLDLYLKQESSYAQYTKQISQLETLLGVSVERYLLDWIGNEISIAQLRKNLDYNKKENAVVLIKTKDITVAKERLHFVSEQVKKRTPALFKQIDYRNYRIEYLEIKGFFKLLFGNKFNTITKPYYTILKDYVVFSNSPYTLIGLIEDYENQRCLETTTNYQNYTDQHDKSSVNVYVSVPNLYPVLYPLADSKSKKSLRESKSYFDAFESFGLNLKGNGEGFRTIATLLKASEPEIATTIEENEFEKLYRLYASERDINSSKFVLEWIEDGMYKKQFPGSDKLQIKADTKQGVLHGSYIEYYQNGSKRITGKYKMGRKKGTWKTFDKAGALLEKKRY